MKVMFWNAENLFDTKHDEGKSDEEFTPDGKMKWTLTRMKHKVDDMARAFAQAGDSVPPAIIGLCEVENDNAMKSLIRWSALGKLGYRYVMTSSADRRGIDVALLYQRERFKLIGKEYITPTVKGLTHVRDILHVSGIVATGDTLDIIVAHLPSRREGAKETEPRRVAVAQRMRSLSDNIMKRRRQPRIIIMGDFNDYPTDKCVSEGLRAKAPVSTPDRNELYHLFLAPQHRKSGHGSYKYQGRWGFLDHIIVSGLLLDSRQRLYTSPARAGELRLPMLLTDDRKDGDKKPFRTYNGYSYNGGVSDHLPVYADFTLRLRR
jgi:predicted extracellular nuclease